MLYYAILFAEVVSLKSNEYLFASNWQPGRWELSPELQLTGTTNTSILSLQVNILGKLSPLSLLLVIVILLYCKSLTWVRGYWHESEVKLRTNVNNWIFYTCCDITILYRSQIFEVLWYLHIYVCADIVFLLST